MLSETRERFARAIVAQIPLESIVEIHFFQPMRQGGVESGVAVIAAELKPIVGVSAAEPREGAEGDLGEECVIIPAHAVEPPPPELELELAEDEAVSELQAAPAPAPTESHRYTVYMARYRLTLKGLDRGKWETSVVAEADAPLPAIDMVVRGVLRRAGDVEDAERMTGEELGIGLRA